MKKAILLTIILIGFIGTELAAQGTVAIPPKLFTLRNARFAMGLGFDINLISTEEEDGSNAFYAYLGSNEDVDVFFEKDDLSYWGISLGLDLYAPNSITSLYAEINYTWQEFNTEYDNYIDRFEFSTVETPFFFKIRLGKVHAKNHVLIMPGYAYNIVTQYSHFNSLGKVTDRSEMSNHFSFHGILAYEIGFGSRKESPNVRTLLFLKGVYRPDTIFATDVLSSPGYDDFDYSDLNLAFGFRFFYNLAGD